MRNNKEIKTGYMWGSDFGEIGKTNLPLKIAPSVESLQKSCSRPLPECGWIKIKVEIIEME